MTVRVIEPSDWQTQAWKNGGGVTHEIWREEHEGKIVFRLSVADVTADGPFSLFPGIDRHIHLLEGSGFCLHFSDGHTEEITYTDKVFTFSGDIPLHCSLINGAVKDFNLMTDRARVNARVSDVLLCGGTMRVDARDLIAIVFVLEGDLQAKVEMQQKAFTLKRYQTAITQQEVGEILVSEGKTSRFIFIEISGSSIDGNVMSQ